MNKRILSISLTVLSCLLLATNALAQNKFTAQEQQSISVETPGLFERSNAFTVDFGQMSASDYSFPLPVGKVEGVRSNRCIMISSTPGDVVKAMFSGTVRMAKNLDKWGQTVVIRHDNGLETVYSNNSRNTVKVGDRVKAGQTIAIIGTRDDKTYCDFSIMVNGARLNVETLIELKSHRLRRQTLLFQKQAKSVIIKVLTEEKEQTINKQGGRRQPQRGNMRQNQNTTVKEESSASNKYQKDSEHVAQQYDDNVMDIDEFQAIKFEENVKTPPPTAGKDFTINFSAMKLGEWCYPMTGAHVISPFGGKRRHAGTDIKRQPGDPILAAFDGQVVLSGTHYGYGLCIVVRHPSGLETLYSHQSKNLVKVGEWVKAGQKIGIVGRTGRATTEHCHFEARINGRPFDTSRIFDHQRGTLKKVILTVRGGKMYIKSANGEDDAAETQVAVHSKGAYSGSSARHKSTKRSNTKKRKKGRR